MSPVAELLHEASKLNRADRMELISALLEGPGFDPHWVSDEEALRRLEDLRSGKIEGLTEDGFWKHGKRG